MDLYMLMHLLYISTVNETGNRGTHPISSMSQGLNILVHQFWWCQCVVLSSNDLDGAFDLCVKCHGELWNKKTMASFIFLCNLARSDDTCIFQQKQQRKNIYIYISPLMSSTVTNPGWVVTIASTSLVFATSTANFPAS